jgi:transglutaminase superfamily protein
VHRAFAKLGRLRRYPRRDLFLLVEAAGMLPVVAASVRLLGIRPSLAWLGRLSELLSSRTPEVDPPGRVRSTGWLVQVAAEHGIHRGNCLSRSITLWWLLRRQGIASAVRIGVRKGEGALDAHAWVEHEGAAVGDRLARLQRYVPLRGKLTP